jgi:hypothetical protein
MKNNVENDFLISEEITKIARDGMGLYFNKINLIDPDTLVADMLNPMRPIRAHGILSRHVDTKGKKFWRLVRVMEFHSYHGQKNWIWM